MVTEAVSRGFYFPRPNFCGPTRINRELGRERGRSRAEGPKVMSQPGACGRCNGEGKGPTTDGKTPYAWVPVQSGTEKVKTVKIESAGLIQTKPPGPRFTEATLARRDGTRPEKMVGMTRNLGGGHGAKKGLGNAGHAARKTIDGLIYGEKYVFRAVCVNTCAHGQGAFFRCLRSIGAGAHVPNWPRPKWEP